MRGFELFGRAIASLLTQNIFSSIWGYRIDSARINKKSIFPSVITGLILASFLHGLFDYLTLTPVLRIFSALLILIIWVWRIKKIEKLNPKN